MRYQERTLAVGAAILATALVLTGCGRASEEGTSSESAPATAIDDGPATGTVTMWTMGSEADALKPFIAEFEKLNPDVTVNVTAVPWAAGHSKLQTAIAGGATPDVAMIGSSWMSEFAPALATVPDNFSADDYFPGTIEGTTVDDRWAAVPWYADVPMLYYRTDLAEKAGWDHPPQSWDDVQELAAAYQSKAGAQWGMRLYTGPSSFLGNLWIPFTGGATLEDGEKWTFTTPEWQHAMEFYKSWFDKGLVDPNSDPAPAQMPADFVSGATPMFVATPAGQGAITQIAGADFDSQYALAPLPYDSTQVSVVGGSHLGVFEKAKNPTAAWKLVHWLSEPEIQARFFEATGDLPPGPAAWKLPALTDNTRIAAVGEALKTALAIPTPPTLEQVFAIGDSTLEQIRKGTVSIPDALESLQQQADQIGLG
ncbi:extracellular solute-binding protein [Microbacterium nymphoidis]|uniref:extracellular solute-binding protein n=1 Tax=Microbacterium nymphoidis TaxID=2898586 RepID=UPI001E601462|nr:extracellular solute-binding protein [Microbacterium nymphoidis]MCD2498174.1 extracellular solute-binding protein [Microbacterium nymphoidis]